MGYSGEKNFVDDKDSFFILQGWHLLLVTIFPKLTQPQNNSWVILNLSDKCYSIQFNNHY